MSDRMSTLLHDAAPRPAGQIDTTALYRQATRRRRGRQGLSAAAILVVIAVALPLAWPSARPAGPIIGDGQTSTPAPGTTIPTQEELLAPFRELFAGLPAPTGTLSLAAGRIDGLGVITSPGTSFDLNVPDYDVEDPATRFTLRVRDADSGAIVLDENYGIDVGPTTREFDTGPVGTRYVVEHDILERDELVHRETDVVVVVEPRTEIDIALVTAPTQVDEHRWSVEYVLINRGTRAMSYGLGYRLYRIDVDGWELVDEPAVRALGFGLGLADVSEPKQVTVVGGPGTYRILDHLTSVYQEPRLGGGTISADVALTFSTDGSTPILAVPDESSDRIRGMIQLDDSGNAEFLPSDDSMSRIGLPTFIIRPEVMATASITCRRTGQPADSWAPDSGEIIEIPRPTGWEESEPPGVPVLTQVFVDC